MAAHPGECRSIAQLMEDVLEVAQDIRGHRVYYAQKPKGLEGEEPEQVEVLLATSESALLNVSVDLHRVQGILLTASVRQMAREQTGQDPFEEETPQ